MSTTQIEAPKGTLTTEASLKAVRKMFHENGLRVDLDEQAKAKITTSDFIVYITDKLQSADKAFNHAAFALHAASTVSDEVFERVSDRLKLHGLNANRLAIMRSMAKVTIPFAIANEIDLSKVALDTIYNVQAALRDNATGKAKADSVAVGLLETLRDPKEPASQAKIRAKRIELQLAADKAAETADQASQAAKAAEAEGKPVESVTGSAAPIVDDSAAKAKAEQSKRDAETALAFGQFAGAVDLVRAGASNHPEWVKQSKVHTDNAIQCMLALASALGFKCEAKK